VFYEVMKPSVNLESVALQYYRYFVGDLWDRFGEVAWMSSWKQIYTRTRSDKPDIVAELRAIADPDAAQFVPILLLTVNGHGDQAKIALADAYNDPEVDDLRVYTIGDGAAMSGLLLAGCRTTGEVTILVSLLD